MIYTDGVQTVEFLTKQTLQDIKSGDTVNVSLSGGTDSALIMFMLCESINSGVIDVTIQPKCVQDIPNVNLISQSIVEVYKNLYPNIKINDLLYLPESINEKMSDIKREYYFLKLDITYNLSKNFTFVGTTSQPTISVLKDKRHGFDRILKDRPSLNDKHNRDYDKYDYQPLLNVDKRFVAAMYQKYNLMNTIYPLTRSCTSNDSILTNRFTEPCKKCWWCAEKKWAFGLYDGEKIQQNKIEGE